MATLKELRDERLRKLDELKKLGINPYPAKARQSIALQQIHDQFDELQNQNTSISVVGRITGIRKFGKIAFIVIKDASGELQLFLKPDLFGTPDRTNSELAFTEINLLDTGDFIEATGVVQATQTGEHSIFVSSLRILTKTLRPTPTQQEGFTNKEERLRRRYVDMSVNKEVYDRFVRRSMFWQATRDFLNKEGFLEINTPVLEHTTGGADANPFVTHMDALDEDFYLRISHELPLKRLIGAGYEKVYDIGPRFRNENYSDEHLPEHVAMEWYWAYADWQQGMEITEKMFAYVLKKTFGTLQFDFNNQKIDFSKQWERWDYAEVIKTHYGINIFQTDIKEVQAKLKEYKLEVEKTDSIARGIDKLWKKIRKDVVGPIWLINTPTFISPLSKTSDEDPRFVQRFQAVIAGSEQANGWSELNDPIEQLDRFLEQQAMREAGDSEAQMLDIDYVEMLEYGMPPTCGLGYSERVFWTFEGVTAREGVPFPQLRRETDQVTKAIYPNVFGDDGSKATRRATERLQDFGKRIVAVVNKELEPWQVTNAVAHMTAIIGNEVSKQQFTSGDVFVAQDNGALPRNSQYPIMIKRASEKDLHKLYKNVTAEGLLHHVFIQEMQDTTDDKAITEALGAKTLDDTVFYGVTFFATNEQADKLAKNFQLFK